MLKEWQIKQFKGIADSGVVHLAPVTVLAGSNSSGKTSFLQSILMVAQTLGSRLLDRPLLPTERSVQLGTIADILHNGVNGPPLMFMCEVEAEDEPDLFIDEENETYWEENPPHFQARIQAVFRCVQRTGNDTPSVDVIQTYAEHVSVRIMPQINVATNRQDYTFSYDLITEEESNQLLQNVTSDSQRFFPYLPGAPAYIGTFDPSFHTMSGTIYFPVLTHFLPTRLVAKVSEYERLKGEIEDVLIGFLSDAQTDNFVQTSFRSVNLTAPFSEELRATLDQLAQEAHLSILPTTNTLFALSLWLEDQKKITDVKHLKSLIRNFTGAITNHLLGQQSDAFGQRLLRGTIDYREELLVRAVESITRFFTRNIRYLGPLRTDPGTTLLQFSSSGELDDVGTKGEYAAFVYHTNQQTQIDFYHPETSRIEKTSLHEALDIWSRYLGIAQTVQTDFTGTTGMMWKIIVGFHQPPRLLPQVGVGVSQILPILVMGLLASAKTLLIIEQPELHLHPRVQARLGDFFLGLARCGKRCLIETHSEYLINQFRYQIVQSNGKESETIAVYFVEPNEQGAAHFTPIQISAQGNILNWPDGFFDESYLQQDRINEEILKRKARKADA